MNSNRIPVPPAEVLSAIASYPKKALDDFYRIRDLVYRTASKLVTVGNLTETTKWGEPAFLTLASKSGSTIRVAWKDKHPRKIGLYFNCKTSLVDTMRSLFAEDFEFQGNRGVLLELALWDEHAVCHCLEMALTYHLKKSINQNARNSV